MRTTTISPHALWLPVVLIAVAACGDAGPLDVPATTGAKAVAAASGSPATSAVRPLTQKSSGLLGPVGACAGGGVDLAAEGSGHATHVGRFDIALTWCLDPATGEIATGDATLVAANGDRLVMTLAGQALSASRLEFQVDIVGGTGRFTAAAGRLDVVATLGANGSWSSEGSGWISY